MVEPDRTQTMWRLRVAYRISKATHPQTHAHARALIHQRARTHARTRRDIGNTSLFHGNNNLRTRLNVTPYAHCLCCCVLKVSLNFEGSTELAVSTRHGRRTHPSNAPRHCWHTKRLTSLNYASPISAALKSSLVQSGTSPTAIGPNLLCRHWPRTDQEELRPQPDIPFLTHPFQYYPWVQNYVRPVQLTRYTMLWGGQFDARKGQEISLFCKTHRPAMRPSQHWVPGHFPAGVMWPRPKADQSPPRCAEITNEWCYGKQGTRTMLPEQGWSRWKISARKETDIGKHWFVNRTIKHWNQLPAEALGTFPSRSRVFRKRVRKVIISEVKWRDLKRADGTSKSRGKWRMGNEVKWSEDLSSHCLTVMQFVRGLLYSMSDCYLLYVFCFFVS